MSSLDKKRTLRFSLNILRPDGLSNQGKVWIARLNNI